MNLKPIPVRLKCGGRSALVAAVVVAVVGLAPLVCDAGLIVGKADLTTGGPGVPNGDGGSLNTLFLHRGYVVPSGGILTKMTVREDGDEVSEEFNLLVLRPTGNADEFVVAARQQHYDDLAAGMTTGTTDYVLNNLPVLSGDLLAHWWEAQPSGAIPFDNRVAGESDTAYDAPQPPDYHPSTGPQSGDLDVGDTYVFQLDGEPRNYWFNVTLIPEPSTLMLAGMGILIVLLRVCRRSLR